MELQQFISDEEHPVRRVPGDDGQSVVADLGVGVDDAALDVVGDTVIVARDEEEFDVELPTSVERAFIKNGVLTIELEADE